MQRRSYEWIISQLMEAASRLVSIGQTNEQSRIYLHISNIRRSGEARKSGSLQEVVQAIGKLQLPWSLVEAVEFADAYANLGEYEPKRLRQNLREALMGPVDRE